MTFTRAKASAWTDDVDTITGTQITQIDVNLTRAADLLDGGTYDMTGGNMSIGSTTAKTWTFTLGTVCSGAATLSGGVTISGGATLTSALTQSGSGGQILKRIYTGTDADQNVQGAAYDIVYVGRSTLTANRTYTLLATSPVPGTGHTLRIVRGAGGAAESIGASTPSAFKLDISYGAVATWQLSASKFGWLDLMWNGTAWIAIGWSDSNGVTAADNTWL